MKNTAILLMVALLGILVTSFVPSKTFRPAAFNLKPNGTQRNTELVEKNSLQRKPEGPGKSTSLELSLQRAAALNGQILLSEADEKEKTALLGSEKLLEEAEAVLRRPLPEVVTTEVMKPRMEALDFFAAAVFWKRNPIRQKVIEASIRLLEKEEENVLDSQEGQEAKAGDWIELYTVLLQADGERAKDLYQKASERNKKLFTFAKSMVASNQKHNLNEGEGK